MSLSAEHHSVVVIGGGPVGLVAANLLARAGIDTVLVERNPATNDDPKAISMDAESLRVLNTFAAGPELNRVMVPGTGVRFQDRRGRRLFQAQGTIPFRYGYAVKSQFAQPELEGLLFDRLRSVPAAKIMMSTELVGLSQSTNGVQVEVRPVGGSESDAVILHADYVIGCDGGRSTTRALSGISLHGSSFDEVWLVVDMIGDDHDERCSVHFGTPDRPHVIVPAADGRCRYEFLLRPEEGKRGEQPSTELVQLLLDGEREVGEGQIERAVNYTFSALVADRWRDRRVFLAGDACHMMPPFAGQGLNSGIRDVANLSWKLAAVISGGAGDAVLDTYEAERKPHAEAIVAASVRQGRIMMTTNRWKALARDVTIRLMLATARGRHYLQGLRYLPSARFDAGLVAPGASALVGSLIDQPLISRADGSIVRLDTELGEGFTLLSIEAASDDVEQAAVHLRSMAGLHEMRVLDIVLHDRRPRSDGPRTAIGDADGALETLLRGLDGHLLLIRPDRYVAACFLPAQAPAVARILGAALGNEESVTSTPSTLHARKATPA